MKDTEKRVAHYVRHTKEIKKKIDLALPLKHEIHQCKEDKNKLLTTDL